MTKQGVRSRFITLPPSRFLAWALVGALAALLALLPLSSLALLFPLVLALLLAPLGPIAGLALAILSVPVQDVWRLPGGLSYTQAAMLLAATAWGLDRLAGARRPSRTGRLLIPWLGFLWALLLAAALSPFSVADGIKETMRWAEAFAIWWIATDTARHPRDIAVLVGCLLLAPLAEAIIGLAQFASGDGPPSFRIAAGLPYVRAYGTIGQPNSFAGYLNMAWPLALALAAGITWRAWRRRTMPQAILAAGLWLVAALLLAALLASFSRGAWLGAALGLLGLALAL
ncbi:MAG TPA: O-antigen ligase family protein, partial [Kouleothrix sp.]|nr:O-antigen ligase family protein [Kouleothrix sp.]